MTATRFKSAQVVPLIMSGWKFAVCGLTVVVLLFALLFIGTVDIPASAVWRTLCGRTAPDDSMVEAIVWAVRLPMALTALAAGASLAVAGLLLQTTFANPLAGPSIMGVSTGASLGVAVVMLGCGSLLGFGAGQYVGALVGALIGSAVVLGILLIFSMFVRSNAMHNCSRRVRRSQSGHCHSRDSNCIRASLSLFSSSKVRIYAYCSLIVFSFIII